MLEQGTGTARLCLPQKTSVLTFSQQSVTHLHNVAQLHAALEDALQERALAGADVALHAQRDTALGIRERGRRRLTVLLRLCQMPHNVLAVLPPDANVSLQARAKQSYNVSCSTIMPANLGIKVKQTRPRACR